ncbi:deoxyribodipyrimidine photo-lyase [Haloferula luteola]|uniref:Deoxyribodipyrimidine photo-lyase n=1 Tax=Haloferula luteola TaxID=595692 RepID=A0A840VE84_9BACT|nr:deoxyribodipyrimidine photo-lyase [Haloferula luteola]MBB5352139.1 deoxyribodipyrimidine photo-lyase [Haloferula luteola]
MSSPPHPVIHWFRRDLRISDNPALLAAARATPCVVPVYIPSTWNHSHAWTGPNRQSFLCQSLGSLSRNLETRGGRLIFRSGKAVEILMALAQEVGAQAIYYNQDPDPFGKSVEIELEKACIQHGIECHGFHEVTLHGPSEVLTQAGDPYRVFTPYSKNWLSLEKPLPEGLPASLDTPQHLRSESAPQLKHWSLQAAASGVLEGGERAAHDRLKTALAERLSLYQGQRDTPSVAGTSRLSQDLRFGLISIRKVYAEAAKALSRARSKTSTGSIETFIKELAWREFYMAILHHFPHVLEEEFNPDWRGLPWDEPGEKFEAWKAGRTGFPIVDAGMRELRETGFMHNRLRMITAMFLTKDLHHDWRWGESYFMQLLTDGEIASNNGGWQWSAGTGADAAPYFRIQNPWSQSARHDPRGEYIRRWIPELKEVPTARLHEPPSDGRPLAADYPLPCVEHSKERDRTLAIFKKHKESRR